jgi:hypothetical protein
MPQIILSQLEKYINIDLNKNDLKSIIMPEVPTHLKEMKLFLGTDDICHWTTFEPNVNLLEQWLYDKNQSIPVSCAWVFNLSISFIYHPHNDTMDPSTYVINHNIEKIPTITNDKCTIYDEGNDEYITGKKVIYNIVETTTTKFYSPRLIIETSPSIFKTNDLLYEMKMWQKIQIKCIPADKIEVIFNKHQMKLEDGTDITDLDTFSTLHLESCKTNEPLYILIVNALSFGNGFGGFRYSW